MRTEEINGVKQRSNI